MISFFRFVMVMTSSFSLFCLITRPKEEQCSSFSVPQRLPQPVPQPGLYAVVFRCSWLSENPCKIYVFGFRWFKKTDLFSLRVLLRPPWPGNLWKSRDSGFSFYPFLRLFSTPKTDLGPKDIHLDKHTFLQPLMFQGIGGVFSPTARHTHHSVIVNIAFSFSMSAQRFWIISQFFLKWSDKITDQSFLFRICSAASLWPTKSVRQSKKGLFFKRFQSILIHLILSQCPRSSLFESIWTGREINTSSVKSPHKCSPF